MFNKPFRLHFSSVIENTLAASWAIILILITNFINIVKEIENSNSKETIWVGLGLLAILGFIFVINWLRWAKTYVVLEDDTIVIEKKLLMAQKTTISLKSISTVNLEENLLQRIFGTYKLKLDINSMTTANQPDAKIVLKKDTAMELKKIITMKSKGESVLEEEKEEDYDIEYDFDKVVLHSILSISIIAMIYAISVFIFSVMAFQNDMSDVGNSLQRIFTIIIMVVPVIYSIFSGIFKLYGFKLKRDKDKIYIKYGLITRNEYAIPIEKINGIVIKQPVLARIFGKYTVELINIGIGEDKNESPVMLLMSSKAEIIENMNKILPDVEILEQTEKQPKTSIIPIAIKVIILSGILLIPTFILIPYFSISVVSFGILSAILMYITREIGVYDSYVKIVNGVFSKKITMLKYEKIQYIGIKKSILTEKLGIAKAHVYILAQAINNRHYTGYFDFNKFEVISEKIVNTNSKV